jgi:hypothetical protein
MSRTTKALWVTGLAFGIVLACRENTPLSSGVQNLGGPSENLLSTVDIFTAALRPDDLSLIPGGAMKLDTVGDYIRYNDSLFVVQYTNHLHGTNYALHSWLVDSTDLLTANHIHKCTSQDSTSMHGPHKFGCVLGRRDRYLVVKLSSGSSVPLRWQNDIFKVTGCAADSTLIFEIDTANDNGVGQSAISGLTQSQIVEDSGKVKFFKAKGKPACS